MVSRSLTVKHSREQRSLVWFGSSTLNVSVYTCDINLLRHVQRCWHDSTQTNSTKPVSSLQKFKIPTFIFCDWVGPNPGWTSPVEQLREQYHRLFLKWDVPCMKHSLMLVSASAHIQQTDVSFVWSTYVSIHCIILHLINTSCVLTHHISLHIIQSKACKTLWCTAASSSLSTVSPDAPAEQILLLIRLLLVLLLSSLGLWPPPSVSPSLLFFLSLQRQIYSSRPRRTSISFRCSFSISGWIQNQKFLWTGGKRRQAGKQEREMDGGGWM